MEASHLSRWLLIEKVPLKQIEEKEGVSPERFMR